MVDAIARRFIVRDATGFRFDANSGAHPCASRQRSTVTWRWRKRPACLSLPAGEEMNMKITYGWRLALAET